jgi:outer membrane protein
MAAWQSGTLVAAAVAASMFVGSVWAADDDPWEVRLRAIYLDPAQKSDAFAPLGIPSNAIHVNDKWLPDLDIEYHFTPHWSSELVLTYPQSQTVTVEHSALGGPTDIGTFKHLPPVLTAKYNFRPEGTFRPYLGAGINLTFISDVSLQVPTVGPLTLNKTSVGPAAQAGFDWKLDEHWFLNADVKWVQLHATVKYDGAPVSQLRIDPLLWGLGIGYRFGGHKAGAVAPAAAVPPFTAPPAAAAPPVTAPPPPPPAPASEQILEGVTFATNSAQLTPGSVPVLDKVVAQIQSCNCSSVTIRGYTDSTGNANYNQRLSERRAAAVQEYLGTHGVPARMLSSAGLGESNPIDSNATASGRAANRRVTVQFTSVGRP